MEHTNPDVIKEVEQGLAARLTNLVIPSSERVGGVDAVAEVLSAEGWVAIDLRRDYAGLARVTAAQKP